MKAEMAVYDIVFSQMVYCAITLQCFYNDIARQFNVTNRRHLSIFFVTLRAKFIQKNQYEYKKMFDERADMAGYATADAFHVACV